MPNLKSGPSKQGAGKTSFTDQKVDTSLPKNPHLGIWARSLITKSSQKIPDFPNFEILARFGPFPCFFGVVSADFGPSWLVPGFQYAKSAINIALKETLFVLGMHAWIFDQFILSCGRYCLLDITYKVFANHMLEISPDH